MNQLTTMKVLMQRINEHIRVEDDATTTTVKQFLKNRIGEQTGKVIGWMGHRFNHWVETESNRDGINILKLYSNKNISNKIIKKNIKLS